MATKFDKILGMLREKDGSEGGVTADGVETLTNKTLDSYTNHIHADGIHQRIKATAPIAYGQPVVRVGYNSGEDAIEVAPRSDWTTPVVGVSHDDLLTGEFGLMMTVGTIESFDTSAYSDGAVLYPDNAGGFTTAPLIENGNYNQPLAYVQKAANNGIIQILVGPGHDVASMVAFDATGSDLLSENTEDAIKEVNNKYDELSLQIANISQGAIIGSVTYNGFIEDILVIIGQTI